VLYARHASKIIESNIQANGSSREQWRRLVPFTSFSEPAGKRPVEWHGFALIEKRPLFALALARPYRADGMAIVEQRDHRDDRRGDELRLSGHAEIAHPFASQHA